MGEFDIAQAEMSDLTNAMTDYAVPSADTDGPSDSKETEYINTLWPQWLGYYKLIPELAADIDAKATWTVGKGFMADEITTMILDRLRGFGKDTFNTILENAVRTYHIGGDAFLEIIKDDDNMLLNLKPLDPSTIKIKANKEGIITSYEQMHKGKVNHTFEPNKIFHLARNRVADEIHGVSLIPVVEEVILMRNESMMDMRTLMHRNVQPRFIFHLDTDDDAKIAAYKVKMDEAYKKSENIYVPKGTVVPELVSVAANATLNPLPWINYLESYFHKLTGVPAIITGGSVEITEASAKISYLAFQQVIEEEQLYVEEQVLAQLNLLIELEFPASLENEMLSEKPKGDEGEVESPEVENEASANEPNDTTAEMEGKK